MGDGGGLLGRAAEHQGGEAAGLVGEALAEGGEALGLAADDADGLRADTTKREMDAGNGYVCRCVSVSVRSHGVSAAARGNRNKAEKKRGEWGGADVRPCPGEGREARLLQLRRSLVEPRPEGPRHAVSGREEGLHALVPLGAAEGGRGHHQLADTGRTRGADTGCGRRDVRGRCFVEGPFGRERKRTRWRLGGWSRWFGWTG